MPVPVQKTINLILNGKPLSLPEKENGQPYYLMDLLQHSGLDFERLNGPVRLEINGVESGFRSALRRGDTVTIRSE